MPKKTQADEAVLPDEQTKLKKPRNVVPKEVITLILDAARSSIKFTAIFQGKVINCPKLPSVFAELENPLHQELGAFSVGLKPKEVPQEEKAKDEIKHYVVGDRATLEINPVAMTQGHDHKIDYFYLLALGAISSIPNLYECSSGTSETSRTLTLKMVVLSLGDGKALLDQLKQCRWMKVNGIKYRLNFLLNHSLYFAEGYGSAVWAKKFLNLEPLNPTHRDVTVFDIGYGTACQTDYVCYGELPLKRFVETNGGGGLGSLVTFLSRAMARGDSSRLIPISEVRQILEDSKFEDGKARAIANDGRDVSEALERAIQWWMTDSPLSFALDSVSLASRRQPVVLVGGSFRIPAIKEKIKQRLERGGAIDSNLLFPENPESLSVQGMVELFNENQKPQLKVVKDGDSNKQETELQRATEISEPNQDSGSTTGDGALLLDSQSA
ncbi:hypothetical protein G7B40_041130 [Aetokthonos hydrillicola Thurmond2011]|jgi:hypothetical protein|uniref:Uncharacterized protein n=1 Tax=Aetokthonos hydrillicola Thurmond2011 TaxID=2712845 RepID=A0AAP5MA75_9CYAN|nr:hypothetical protein [Aetokthonos hydrillicola]MBO3463406.1 hypothetical protein [Aetokthonos hydrillicola CCALA 1050]MBW4590865.1 hypothetical protein [Aetokthonos hydrillicola CCALA 1050]MDR9900891.1 hypothetical protein [Aetokthonos hydrillicola Thurmond2011]